MGNQCFWKNPTSLWLNHHQWTSWAKLIFGPHMIAPYGAPFCFFKKRTTITEKLPLPATSQVFWGGKFSMVAIIYLMIFHRLLFLLPSSTLENYNLSLMSLTRTEKRGKKKEKKKNNYNDQETGKAIIYSNKKTASPLFKTWSYYLSNQHSKADFTTGIV